MGRKVRAKETKWGKRTRVPNGPSKTGLDRPVWSKVRSILMVEIRPTGWSGLADQT